MGRLRLKGPGLTHLSPSGGSVLQACEQQYVYRYGKRGMRDPSTQATALGSGFAWALETGSVDAGIREYLANRPPVDPVFDDPAVIERAEVVARAMITHAYAAYVQRFGPGHDIEREVTYIVRLPAPTPRAREISRYTGGPLDPAPLAAYSPRLLQVRVDGAIDGVTLVEDKLRSSTTLRPDAIENEARDLARLGDLYRHDGRLDQAAACLEESLSLHVLILGDDHVDTLPDGLPPGIRQRMSLAVAMGLLHSFGVTPSSEKIVQIIAFRSAP